MEDRFQYYLEGALDDLRLALPPEDQGRLFAIQAEYHPRATGNQIWKVVLIFTQLYYKPPEYHCTAGRNVLVAIANAKQEILAGSYRQVFY